MTSKTPKTICDYLEFRADESPQEPLMAFHDRWWSRQEVRDWIWQLALGCPSAAWQRRML